MIPESHREILKSTVKEIIVVDKGNSGYDRENGIIYLLEGLTEGEVIHEAAHAIETALDLYSNERFLKVLANAVKGYTSKDIIFDPETFTVSVFRLKSSKFISEYQGVFRGDIYDDSQNINIIALQEYFSEGYRGYMVNPKRLKSIDPALYNFIEELE